MSVIELTAGVGILGALLCIGVGTTPELVAIARGLWARRSRRP